MFHIDRSLRRHSGEEHPGQHDHRAVCWPDESTVGQGAQRGPGSGPIQRSYIPQGSLEEARNYGRPGQGLPPDRDPEPDGLRRSFSSLKEGDTFRKRVKSFNLYLNYLHLIGSTGGKILLGV